MLAAKMTKEEEQRNKESNILTMARKNEEKGKKVRRNKINLNKKITKATTMKAEETYLSRESGQQHKDSLASQCEIFLSLRCLLQRGLTHDLVSLRPQLFHGRNLFLREFPGDSHGLLTRLIHYMCVTCCILIEKEKKHQQ